MVAEEPAPRPAATVIVMREAGSGRPELLMAQRSAAMVFAGGALVFPGGAVDEADRRHAAGLALDGDPDDHSARIAAVREALEECGLAVALREPAGAERVERARQRLHGGASLAEVAAEFALDIDLDALVPFARWCPPVGAARKRFDTRFYLACAGDHARHDLVPDGSETARLLWVTASDALSAADRGEAPMLFPTRSALERIAQFDSIAAVIADAEAHPVRLIVPWSEERDGERHLCIPEGCGYPVTSRPATRVDRG